MLHFMGAKTVLAGGKREKEKTVTECRNENIGLSRVSFFSYYQAWVKRVKIL